jgi:site-specific DNA-adenine methylase
MAALGREADFLHSTVDRYIEDARNDNNSELVQVWNNIKQDKQKHLDMLKRCLEKDVQQGQLKQ